MSTLRTNNIRNLQDKGHITVRDENIDLVASSPDDLLNIGAGGTIFTSKKSGNIGIGTTLPKSTLDVNGDVRIEETLDVWGITTIHNETDSESLGEGSFLVSGGTSIEKQLNVGGQTRIYDETDSSFTDDGALVVDGGVGVNKQLNVGGQTRIYDETDSLSLNDGALVVDGGVGVNKQLNVGGITKIENITESTSKDNGSLIVDGGVGIEKQLNVGGITKIENTTNSTSRNNGALIIEGGVGVEKDIHADKYFGDGENLVGIVTQLLPGIGVRLKANPQVGKEDYRGSVTVDAYKPTGKTIFVTQNGDDNNTGLTENHSKRTIKAAASAAVYGDTIKVYPGTYVEENPIILKKTVSVEGTELRNCVVTAKYPYLDLFHVNNGCHITDLSFIGPPMTDGAAIVALQPLSGVAVDRYFDAARMIRMNLDYIAHETVGFLTSGFSGFAGNHREQDAARLIDKNIDFIASEAVGFLTSTSGLNFTVPDPGTTQDCADDIRDIFRSISYDLKANSNKKSVGAALSYFGENGELLHITGEGVSEATVLTLEYAVEVAKSVINGVAPLQSYSDTPQVFDPSIIQVEGGCVEVGEKISSLVGIITSSIGAGSTDTLPPIQYGVNLESKDCVDDIKDIWKCVIHDITRGGNSKCITAGKAYYDEDWNLIPQILKNPGEVEQTISALNYSFDIARSVVNNCSWGGYPTGTKINVSNAIYDNTSGITTITASDHGITEEEVRKGIAVVKVVGLGFTCPSDDGLTELIYPTGKYGYIFPVKNYIDEDTIEIVVGQSTLPHTYTSGGTVQKYGNFSHGKYQVKDLGIQKDPLTGFNDTINSCANVISAMHSCVGIVTHIVGLGSDAFNVVGIKTTYPGNSGIGFTSVIEITSAVYDESSGKTTIMAPGFNLQKGEIVELRDLEFSCESSGVVSTQKFPSGTYGYQFYVDKVNNDGSFDVYVGPSSLPHTYEKGGIIVDRSVSITTCTYDNISGITTITATGSSIETGDLVVLRGLEFSCESGAGTTTIYPTGNNGFEFKVLDIITDKPFNITNAEYDNLSGIATITSPGINLEIDDIVEIKDLEFSCPDSPPNLMYPSGISGYKFKVIGVDEDTFTINVGPTEKIHTYIGGGIAANKTQTSSDTFTVQVGPSTIPHTYVSGGIVIPPYSPGVGQITQGPYVRNCTNFVPNSIGMKVDGFEAEPGDTDDIGVTGTMSVDSYTQYNQGGIGVSITNGAYAQLVSIFTICNDTAIYTASGGQCDITNSNSSFGTRGLVSEGVGDQTSKSIYRLSGYCAEDAEDEQSIIKVGGIGTYRPYDGQVLYFGELYYTIQSIEVLDSGGDYDPENPPEVIISAPEGENGILAEAIAVVDEETRKISSIELIGGGTQYKKNQKIDISIAQSSTGKQAVARPILYPIYYTLESASLPKDGVSTIVLNNNLNSPVSAGTTVYFSRLSLQITSSHSFEWVGSGNNIFEAKPALGGVVNPDNEVVKINGGEVVYTSTDQAGNFKIGDGVVINQITGTISGRSFSQSLLNTVTPLIVSIG